MFVKQIGIDLGTVNVLVYVKGKGVVIQEPSVVAISVNENKIVAVGNEAREMLGRTPDTIEVMRPLRDGVIADYVVTEAMLRYFVEKVCGRFRLFKPRIMISVPVGVTSVESRAVHEAALQAGGKEVYLIPEPLAAAYGAGMPIGTPTGNMVVDIGGGASEAAVVSMNDIVVSSSVRVGGNRIDEAIMSYIRKKYNLIIGDLTAEEIKIRIGSALPLEEELKMEVQGRDQVAGLPRTIVVSSGEVTEAIAEPLAAIVSVVRAVLEKTPPELSSDIIDRGIALVGGGALLRNIDRLLTRETGVPCYVADNPMACTAIGAGKGLDNIHLLRRSLPSV
ncbi:MAG: rod shape-determining protein [Anaerolineae bacterium]|jgi:rod shape-determining protein MreB|nr:rod shape-determining protein [Anaerolineae bacterium]MDH7474621.1 rod shape-determining protein [Anaerolineae bacterium]